MNTTDNTTHRVFIVELADLINRRPATIRGWDRTGILPANARPERNERGWRYWTEEQVPIIKQWIRDQELRPGKGLSHYNPSPEEVEAHIDGQRLPRDPVSVALRRGLIDQELAGKVLAGDITIAEAKRVHKGRGRPRPAVAA